jgi:CelD/BcsL family acetyltransferase involved in cellulose biosynthesis
MMEIIEEPGAATGALTARTWSTEEFATSKEAWDHLVASSDADPLFMSWDWQWLWWKHHAGSLDAALQLIAVYADHRLVGLAPFYSHQVTVRRMLRVRRLELIGCAWRDARATFSDYLDIIAARDWRDSVRLTIAEWLGAQPFWDELAFCCTRRNGVAAALVEENLERSLYVREVDPLSGWCVQLPSSFERYLEQLSSDVRRKLFYQRRKLVDPEVQCANKADVEEFLHELMRYSAERWSGGKKCKPHLVDPESRRFLLDVALCMARAGQLRLSRLRSDGRTLSVMYNARLGGTTYFLQSGFDPGARGISPGYLHFGYAIEAACRENADRFDFLAGPGRHRDYKRDFRAEPVALVTYHVVRRGGLASLYAAYETLARWIGLRS